MHTVYKEDSCSTVRVESMEKKKQAKDGFYVIQINEGGIFTYLCCTNCKPCIDKEYKRLKINIINDEFYTNEEFKKLNSKVEAPCCAFCEKVFYHLDTKKPIKRSESKKKRWNRILTKYCIDQKSLLDKCLKYGKKRDEEFLLSDEALWELTQTIQQKCRNFIEMEKIKVTKKKKQKKK